MADRRVTRALCASALLASAGLLAGACARPPDQLDVSTPLSAAAASAPSIALPPDAAADAPASLPPSAWAEAVRVGRWKDVARLIDALDGAEQSTPELRYVRARAALALGDHATAARLLDGLEKPMPALADDIAFHRAEAWIHTGPAEEAARYFDAQTGVSSLVKAARAWEKAARPREARLAADRAVHAAGRKTDAAAVEAHAVRARIAEAAGDRATATADLRFVSRHDPSRAESEGLDGDLTRLDPRQSTTASEHIDRAHRLAREGNSRAAMEAIDKAATAPGKPSPGALAYAKAMSLYLDRAHYSEAAEAFDQVSALDRKLAPEAGYYAAKAWARADQNPKAAARYSMVARSYPKTRWGDRAAYQAARLHMLEASWQEASRSFNAYLAAYPKGESAETARYELAVSTLLSGKHERARKLLGDLAGRIRDPLAAATLRHLEAIAAFECGDQEAAVARWNDNIRTLPLSWPALVGAARLAAAGRQVPAAIQPPAGSSSDPLAVPLPQTAALLQRLGLDDEAEEWIHSRESELSKPWGPRSGEALCSLYGQLAPAHRRYKLSQRVVSGQLLDFAPSSSTRWAWDCVFPRPYSAFVEDLHKRDAIPRGLLHSIMRQESAFFPEARSPVGALGLMQLMPGTARKIAEETGSSYDPNQLWTASENLDLSARYVARLLRELQGNIPLSVAAYNAGPKAVGRWLARAGDLSLDLWVARIPYGETRRYVWRVMGNLARYGYLERGEEGIPRLDLKLPADIKVADDSY